ncbi:MAG: hypothetical protein QMD80_01745 [archaeon]|nr:hypothetical protein [archaeon]
MRFHVSVVRINDAFYSGKRFISICPLYFLFSLNMNTPDPHPCMAHTNHRSSSFGLCVEYRM